MTGPAARFGALTSDDVRRLDAAAVGHGVDVLLLMEVAGWQVARCAWRLLGRRAGRVLVVAGRGNNGGDALVAARHLHAWGCDIDVAVVGDRRRWGEPVTRHADTLRALGVEVAVLTEGDAVADALGRLAPASLVVDGILGTGLRSDPREPEASAIRALGGRRVLAIDVPSGLDASSGTPLTPCVTAAATCTLAALKAGLLAPQARAHAGVIHVADIGMPRRAWESAGLRPPPAVRGGCLVRVPSDRP